MRPFLLIDAPDGELNQNVSRITARRRERLVFLGCGNLSIGELINPENRHSRFARSSWTGAAGRQRVSGSRTNQIDEDGHVIHLGNDVQPLVPLCRGRLDEQAHAVGRAGQDQWQCGDLRPACRLSFQIRIRGTNDEYFVKKQRLELETGVGFHDAEYCDVDLAAENELLQADASSTGDRDRLPSDQPLDPAADLRSIRRVLLERWARGGYAGAQTDDHHKRRITAK